MIKLAKNEFYAKSALIAVVTIHLSIVAGLVSVFVA